MDETQASNTSARQTGSVVQDSGAEPAQSEVPSDEISLALAERDTRIRELEASLRVLETRVRDMRSTVSWRISAPLREIERQIRRLVRFLARLCSAGGARQKQSRTAETGSSAHLRQRPAAGFYDLSDGEFILNVAELLYEGRGATPNSVERWRQTLRERPARRNEFVRTLIDEHIDRQRRGEAPLHNPHRCWLVGTHRYLTPATWKERAAEVNVVTPKPRPARTMPPTHAFNHSGNYVVSAIASLYKGRRFIESFLDNITSQTIFDRCELIIIDANSPEREDEVIAEFQKTYPNIVYKRINYRIGVYDAWNTGIELARGKYLTNTNVDDLRRLDSLELQARALERNPSIDVVYQDVFYTFDPFLSFDEVARLGFKSDFPVIAANNLLTFNSPHNAPMWRKTLHDEVGLFDTSFVSAGDWEFWLRCLWNGKKFFKGNAAHVTYFQNPIGLSTRAETRSIAEGFEIMHRYCRRLISPHLLLSRKEFAELLGNAPDWEWKTTYYQVVQNQLKRLGDQYMVATSA